MEGMNQSSKKCWLVLDVFADVGMIQASYFFFFFFFFCAVLE